MIYYAIPFLLLGRLAVDLQYQGKGCGDALIFQAFHRTAGTAEKIVTLGTVTVVDTIDENAARFYQGFVLLDCEKLPTD